MPESTVDLQQQHVNVLLPHPLEQAGGDVVAALASSDRSLRRAAIAEIQDRDIFFEDANADMLTEVLDKLARASGTRASGASVAGARSAARRAATGATDAMATAHLSIDELEPGVGPPEDMPVYNPYTGVLTVPAFAGVASTDEAVSSVRSAVTDMGDAVHVEPIARHRVSAAMDRSLDTEPEIFGAPAEFLFDESVQEEWLEAALQEGSAGEIVPWGIERVRAPRAWALGILGQGIAVAVVDTGIAPHIDLPRPMGGATFIPGTNSYVDDHGHGTHVAGTIAAKRGNGRGVVGVAPGAQLIAVKVLASDGFARGDSVALGITWAANNGARVINLSLGSPVASESDRRAVLHARSRNVVVCAAAGNGYGKPVDYPAAFDDFCIAVAASDQSDKRAAFSNVGPQLDLTGPGVKILSTYPGNGYVEMQGTSMATPHVAGVAALLLSKYPNLSAMAVQRHLERTARPLGPPKQFGRGLVQVDRAVGTPPEADPPPGGGGVAALSGGRNAGREIAAAGTGGPDPAPNEQARAAGGRRRRR